MTTTTKETDSTTSNKNGYKKTKLGWIPKEWEVVSLGEYFDFKNGLNKEKEFFGFGTPIINYMDVNKNSSLTKNKILGKVSLTKGEIKRFNIKKGDVFFTRTSETIEEIAFSSVLLEDVENGVFSGFVLRARPKSGNTLDINYLKYCFSTYLARKEIMSKSSLTTRALTNGTLLSEVNLLLPPLPEQEKIAQILSTWDDAIAKQTDLIAQKEALKKGLMQELLTGKKRLKGFTDKWKEVKLGEVLTFGSGKDYKHLNSGNIPVFGTGGFMTSVDDYLYDGDSVGIGRKGTINKPIFLSGKFWTVDTLFYTHSFKNILPFYVYLKFQTINWKFYNEASGVPSLSKSTIEKIKILLPALPEQQKIATILSAADTEIEKLKAQKSAIETQKKGLMQILLTGKVRVKH
ncbi:restriction endonuclease subunit S [Acidiluteibacter ferrifornacis]|uniref:Restriction endonuclease subunit S n=1 Tax=Acidiluteibacter ferrifornacis TaxID=2692424 RepID=A0A6N9NKU5_9FLAO|nr:restriction endonuclease subunit S [Acidiluteibacter ferrifornacis]NBG67328.1 restriction endonuclease subunit S [Acidiluteibacter ferrifornacis]